MTSACKTCPSSSAWIAAACLADDGPTHHGLFDISYLRGIPNIIHMVPKDEDALADMMYTAMLHEGPSAIRYPRGTGPASTVKSKPVAIPIGKADVLQDGHDVAIFALGAMMAEGARLGQMLEAEGLSVALIDPRFTKPVDAACIHEFGSKCRSAHHA